jgi:hypothetical protein
MPSTLRILVVLGAALIAGAALALENKKVANNNAALRSAHQGQSQEETAMQAMCREILVDTDEGYGVTNHESRVICDALR